MSQVSAFCHIVIYLVFTIVVVPWMTSWTWSRTTVRTLARKDVLFKRFWTKRFSAQISQCFVNIFIFILCLVMMVSLYVSKLKTFGHLDHLVRMAAHEPVQVPKSSSPAKKAHRAASKPEGVDETCLHRASVYS